MTKFYTNAVGKVAKNFTFEFQGDIITSFVAETAEPHFAEEFAILGEAIRGKKVDKVLDKLYKSIFKVEEPAYSPDYQLAKALLDFKREAPEFFKREDRIRLY